MAPFNLSCSGTSGKPRAAVFEHRAAGPRAAPAERPAAHSRFAGGVALPALRPAAGGGRFRCGPPRPRPRRSGRAPRRGRVPAAGRGKSPGQIRIGAPGARRLAHERHQQGGHHRRRHACKNHPDHHAVIEFSHGAADNTIHRQRICHVALSHGGIGASESCSDCGAYLIQDRRIKDRPDEVPLFRSFRSPATP